MLRRLVAAVTVSSCVLGGAVAHAQRQPADAGTPAHISSVEGKVQFERGGAVEAAVENLPLLESDRLRTEDGRLAVLLPDASRIDIDRQSVADLLAGGVIRLVTGRMLVTVSSPQRGEAGRQYQVDTPAGTVRLSPGGEYRVTTAAVSGVPFVDVAVVRGEAVLAADGQSRGLRAGQHAQATRGQGITATATFDPVQRDEFATWAEQQRDDRTGSASNAYLPPDLQVYSGAFDRDGTWDDSEEYGHVWYPRVGADWRPYHDGGWQAYSWGWTWVGAGPWVWPTHHYGRWGYGTRGWYWMPGAQWGPAWVSWSLSTDMVGWCPLGYDDSPVFSFTFGFSSGRSRDPWFGWTVLPSRWFGRGHDVARHALSGPPLRALAREAFVPGAAGPSFSGHRGASWTMTPGPGPYERAGVATSGRPAGAVRPPAAASSDRPDVSERPWTANPDSPYGRAQDVAGARLAQTAPGASARMRAYDVRPFASPSQPPPPYPGRFQSPVGRPADEPLGDVARRSAPASGRSESPSYGPGPSERQRPASSDAPTPRTPAGGRTLSAPPRPAPSSGGAARPAAAASGRHGGSPSSSHGSGHSSGGSSRGGHGR